MSAPRGPPAALWWLAAGLLMVLSALALTAEPGVAAGTHLLGRGTADLWGHAWGYWWAADSAFHGVLPYASAPIRAPEGQAWWLVDLPVALALAPITRLTDAGTAYHLSLALRLGLAGGGLTWWLWRLGASRRVAFLGAAALCLGPMARGMLASCLPEALSLFLAPVFGQLLADGLRGKPRTLGVAAAAGMLLVLDGAYSGLAAAMMGVFVVVGVVVRQPSAGLVGRAALAALPAAVAGTIQLLLVAATGHRALAAAPDLPASALDWPAVTEGGSDLLLTVAHSWMLPEPSPDVLHRHVAYVGVFLLFGAVWASRRSAAARALALLGVVSLTLSLGARLTIAGVPHLPLPGWLLVVYGGSNIYRLAALAGCCLVGAVVVGLRGRVAAGVLAVVLLDGLAAFPLGLPSLPRPEGVVEAWLAQTPGSVLDLPLDRDGQGVTGAWPQRTFYLQTVHGRPIASGLQRTNRAVRALSTVHAVEAAVGGAVLTADRSDRPRAVPNLAEATREADLDRLTTLGFTAISYDSERVPESVRTSLDRWMTRWLGAPDVESGLRRAWAIDGPDDG